MVDIFDKFDRSGRAGFPRKPTSNDWNPVSAFFQWLEPSFAHFSNHWNPVFKFFFPFRLSGRVPFCEMSRFA